MSEEFGALFGKKKEPDDLLDKLREQTRPKPAIEPFLQQDPLWVLSQNQANPDQELPPTSSQSDEPRIDPLTNDVLGDPIEVTGMGRQEPTPNRPRLEIPDRPPVMGEYILNDNRVPPTKDDMKEIIERKGMFGIKGTLRDVLGGLGDALLIGSGGNPIYMPQRQREKEGDAMFGASKDPIQAAERLAAAGYPEAARSVLEQARAEELKRAQVESLRDQREASQRDNRQKSVLQLSNWAARILRAADTPEKQAYALQLIGNMAERNGLSAEDLGLGGQLTPEQRSVYASGDMTVNQQEMLPRRDRQLDISQQNADTSRISATRPRAGSQPRAQTETEYFRSIMDKRPGDRTVDEQAYIDNKVGRNRGGRGVTGRTLPKSIDNGRTAGWKIKRN